jgi:EAL domain-containing protein (putative c-di-GMP-specific phosphodiesterase class I)
MTDALDLVCFRSAILNSAGMDETSLLFINIEATSIMNNAFKMLFLENGLKMPIKRLVFEITERTEIADYKLFVAHLNFFRQLGIKIALDDAGSGYSSLNHIVKIQPDFIKLDMVLVQNIDTDALKRNLVESFVRFAKGSNISVIAEGIENEAELNTLQQIGVNYFQGYFLHRPCAADALRGSNG